jgi:hypothetical protein
MKKIKNMNFQEAKEAFSKWEAKHPGLMILTWAA